MVARAGGPPKSRPVVERPSWPPAIPRQIHQCAALGFLGKSKIMHMHVQLSESPPNALRNKFQKFLGALVWVSALEIACALLEWAWRERQEERRGPGQALATLGRV